MQTSSTKALRPLDASASAKEGVCEVDVVDVGKVARARARLPSYAAAADVAEAFAAFADPTRLRLLHALAGEELCVCDLACLAERSMAAVSRQLQQLRRAGLVRYRTAGKLAYYSLEPARSALVREALKQLGAAEARR